MFYARGWLSTTIEDFVAALNAYIRGYNEVRINSSLGFRRLAEHAGAWAWRHIQSKFLSAPPRAQFSFGANSLESMDADSDPRFRRIAMRHAARRSVSTLARAPICRP
jgi:hypothetical protein